MAAHPAPGDDEDTGLADLGQMFEDEDGWQGPRVVSPQAGVPVEPAAPAPVPPGGTAADLRLLRSSAAVRARAAAAVVLPFVLYVVVMIVIGRPDRILLFLWAPILIAGVLFGAVLDWGHRGFGTVSG